MSTLARSYRIGDTIQWPPHLGTVIEVTDRRVRVEWDDGMVGVFLIRQAPEHAVPRLVAVAS